MMSNKKILNKEDVKKVSVLANLELSEKELEKFTVQLEEIIEYNMRLLDKVDTTGQEPAISVNNFSDNIREDEAFPGLTTEEAIQNAKETHNDLFKVKAILGND